MGAAGSAVRHRCAYTCTSGTVPCTSKEGYDVWLTEELHRAMESQDGPRLEELLGVSPQLKERELQFPGEASPMTVLALALNRRDLKIANHLLRAGVSPNLPISEQQRSVYAQRSQLAALNGGDPDLQNLVPSTHFEALCAVTHKELFLLMLEYGANPSSGLIQICHCGDLEMLEALLARGADPNGWLRESTPMVTSVKSKMQPYEKVLTLLRAAADPNFTGPERKQSTVYPAMILATRKRDYKMVRALLEAGGDVNRTAGDEGLPNALFWATYWGELELIKLFISLSKHRLDLSVKKYTDETVFDVARTSRGYADLRKPRHIAKLPLPSRPAVVYDKIYQLLEQYRSEHPDPSSPAGGGPGSTETTGRALPTGSTTAATTGRAPPATSQSASFLSTSSGMDELPAGPGD